MKNKKIFNTVFFAVMIYALYLRLPTILNHFSFQDQQVPNLKLRTINPEGETAFARKKLIVVFWATWCGPCEVELKRINAMIEEKKLSSSSVLAIASQEDQHLVEETVKKNRYLFPIGLDSDGIVAAHFKVSATPTILFIDENQTISWMTSGISPSLTFRISSFLK